MPISEKIKDRFFELIEGSLPNEQFASYNTLTREIFLFITSIGYTKPNICWVYNMATQDWTLRTLTGTPLCANVIESTNDTLWDVGIWDSDLWDSMRGEGKTYIGFLDGKVSQFTSIEGDYSTPFTCYWTSGEFNFGDTSKFYSLDKVTIELVASADFTLTVGISVDGGYTFTDYTKAIASSSATQRVAVYTNVAGKTFVFKVSFSSNYFRLNSVLVEGKDAGIIT